MKINRIVNEGFMKTMLAAYLPGNSTVDLREVAVPTPGINQVLIKMKSSGICGSDVHYIYHQHRATAAAPDKPLYQGFINGHEPCGQIVAMGQGCRHFKEGDRVLVYHISGCGFCPNCRRCGTVLMIDIVDIASANPGGFHFDQYLVNPRRRHRNFPQIDGRISW
ncbi:alcohol dehydrogenase catalytic domain-containing protein [Escherichia coli]|uniref:alcohol dehydrogenase catalytic domain-containing protein n=1 Tax=Escherichia coli TaxID=562 RepID=UPI003F5290BE